MLAPFAVTPLIRLRINPQRQIELEPRPTFLIVTLVTPQRVLIAARSPKCRNRHRQTASLVLSPDVAENDVQNDPD